MIAAYDPMHNSVKGEYALQAILDLASRRAGEPIRIADIAQRLDDASPDGPVLVMIGRPLAAGADQVAIEAVGKQQVPGRNPGSLRQHAS